MPEVTAREQSVYKSDTNQMNVLQLLCVMVGDWIKGTLSLCGMKNDFILLVLCHRMVWVI